jgi:cytidylate kinase
VPIITISRTFGSGGAPIGRELARRFKAEFLDRSIVASVAERSGITESEAEGYDEQLPSIWQRVAAALATSSPEISMPPLPSGDVFSGGAEPERLARLTRGVIEEAGERGNAVILGRGAAFIIGRRRDAVHVHLHAPLESRVRNLQTRVEEIPADVRPDAASLRDLCRHVDGKRARYIRRLFGVDWLDVSNYDLAIDTSSATISVAVDLVELAVRRRLGAGK